MIRRYLDWVLTIDGDTKIKTGSFHKRHFKCARGWHDGILYFEHNLQLYDVACLLDKLDRLLQSTAVHVDSANSQNPVPHLQLTQSVCRRLECEWVGYNNYYGKHSNLPFTKQIRAWDEKQ